MHVEELYSLAQAYRYKIDLHVHTAPASPCAEVSAEETARLYAERGYDAIAVTNHFIRYLFRGESAKEASRRYLKDYADAKRAGAQYGLQVLLGMEIRFPENHNDYLVYGLEEADVERFFPYLQTSYETFYKAVHGECLVILQAHPFRDGMELQNPALLDGIETFNCHPHHNSRIAPATDYAKAHPGWIVSAGTDFHHLGHQGMACIRSQTCPADSKELAALLRSGNYLFDVCGSIVLP